MATPIAMAARILEIVEPRGKMHNPETDSGGVLLGTVAAVGERFDSPASRSATRIVTLASLTVTPLRLDAVTVPGSRLASGRGHRHRLRLSIERRGRPIPDDLPLATALEIYDVCAAGLTDARLWRRRTARVCVLGAGHAGKLALAAARDSDRIGGTAGRRRTSTRRRSSGSPSSGSATSA